MSSSNNEDVKVDIREEKNVHPLLKYDPHFLEGGIQLLKLEYFEDPRTQAPVPRNQEVPKDAFGTLTDRSILVATSHAWFHQCHPDPEGVKLKILREKFFPKLRERFPNTQILVFDDWHSCPQWPRETKEEEDRFNKCMKHMNSIYCYSDVILFVEADLPKLDETVFKCDLIPSEHRWLRFIDTFQYLGGDEATKIQKNDIIVQINGVDTLTMDILKATKTRTTISFLRRPYGRPNRTPAKERGWLYAERITAAIRMAAARPESFDDVVVSNNPKLTKQIFLWSDALRKSARKEKKRPGSISLQLKKYQDVLATMKFTFPNNDTLVDDIIKDLVKQFEENWDEEVRRQGNMARRARELLLRWGEFSEEYIERAGFLVKEHDSVIDVVHSMVRMLCLLICPVFSLYLFCFDYSIDPNEDVLGGSIFTGLALCVVSSIVHSPLRLEFVGYGVGFHTLFDMTQSFVQDFCFSYAVRLIFGVSIVPFEYLVVCVLAIMVGNKIIFGPKWIPWTDPRTNENVKLSLRVFKEYSSSKYFFNEKIKSKVALLKKFAHLTYAFAFMYV